MVSFASGISALPDFEPGNMPLTFLSIHSCYSFIKERGGRQECFGSRPPRKPLFSFHDGEVLEFFENLFFVVTALYDHNDHFN